HEEVPHRTQSFKHFNKVINSNNEYSNSIDPALSGIREEVNHKTNTPPQKQPPISVLPIEYQQPNTNL
ncbi:MAG: hypothetical protein AB8G86_23730, partial [Saprospiraceae bacterium]